MSWIDQAVFYHIYPLGFCGVLNEQEAQVPNPIQKIESWIPHLVDLGVNAVYLGPICESVSHGYDTTDYFKIDHRLGSNEAFMQLVKNLHEAGIKVVLDGVFNHVGREFGPFKDLQQNGRSSKYKDWFVNVNFDCQSPYGDAFCYDAWEGHFSLVRLNLNHPEVRAYILSILKLWIDTFDIDGLRLDVAYCMEPSFLRELKTYCLSQKEDFWVMGEIIHGDYSLFASRSGITSMTGYECYKGNYSSHNDENYFEINYSLNRLFGPGGIYKNLALYNFVDNHDVTRIASILRRKEHLENVYTLLFTMPGIPSIYYGSEWGIEGVKQKGSDDDLRPELDLKEMLEEDQSLVKHIKKLADAKKELIPLQKGNYETIIVRNKQLVFKRSYEAEQVFVILNLEDKLCHLSFSVGDLEEVKDYLGNKVYKVEEGHLNMSVPAFSAMILGQPKEEADLEDEIGAEEEADLEEEVVEEGDALKEMILKQ